MSGQGAQTKAGPSPAPSSDQPYFLQDLDLLTTELRAAASDGIFCIVDAGYRVHLATKLLIFTHTNCGKSALVQPDLFESMGVKARVRSSAA